MLSHAKIIFCMLFGAFYDTSRTKFEVSSQSWTVRLIVRNLVRITLSYSVLRKVCDRDSNLDIFVVRQSRFVNGHIHPKNSVQILVPVKKWTKNQGNERFGKVIRRHLSRSFTSKFCNLNNCNATQFATWFDNGGFESEREQPRTQVRRGVKKIKIQMNLE